MPNYRSGFTGTASVGGNELSVVGWSVAPNAEILVYKNSKTGNHPQRQSTFTDATATIDVDWSDADQPFGAPTSLVIGATVANVKLHLDGTSGSLYWNFTSMVVMSTPQQMVREGKIVTRIELGNSGTFANPGGSLS